MSLRTRHRLPELMDQAGLDPAEHRRALAGLARINALSGVVGRLGRRLESLARPAGDVPLRVLDVACGGGDVLLGLARRSRRRGRAFCFEGRDLSATAVAEARSAANRLGLTNINFRQGDALRDDADDAVPADGAGPPRFDAVLATLFLHHLEPDDAIALLRRMAAEATQAVLVDDLRRTRLGHALAWAGCRLLSRSPVVHVDGPRSVRAAFTDAEALQLASAAGLHGATASRHWPERFLLEWRRPRRTT